MNDNQPGNDTGSTGESQSSATGNNKARGNDAPSSPGMQPGIEQQAINAAREKARKEDRESEAPSDPEELSNQEQQAKEAMTERD